MPNHEIAPSQHERSVNDNNMDTVPYIFEIKHGPEQCNQHFNKHLPDSHPKIDELLAHIQKALPSCISVGGPFERR